MDTLNMWIFFVGTAIILIGLSIIHSRARKNLKPNEQPMAENRQVVLMRNVRHRMQGNANHANHLREANDDRQINQNYEEDKDDKIDHKIGTKKRIKLAAKAEKKVQREAAEREREERKKREQLLQEERDKQAEKEYVEQLRVEETEKKAREEKEKQEYEEYLKMKEAFSVEEEGYEQENNECENLLQEFLAYIKLNKVLILEDLAAHFGLKTASVVERIQELQANGNLTGVIDDRGKFIYISEDELQAVAKFVRQRGRVSIAELAENSNNLINLTPAKSCSVFVR